MGKTWIRQLLKWCLIFTLGMVSFILGWNPIQANSLANPAQETSVVITPSATGAVPVTGTSTTGEMGWLIWMVLGIALVALIAALYTWSLERRNPSS